jgi:outer membrane receptor protein involved in Fe transport
MKQLYCVGTLLAATSVLALATAANAQTAPANPNDGATISEVVVTAQRREESLQDVPIAVTALSSDQLKAQRVDSADNLNLTVPNLSFQPAPYGEANFSIRGIGYQIVTAGGDAGVGIHENNAPLTVSRLAEADFFDLQRVEVLRGPQGTLYGRNATGGVINSITAKPTDDFAGSVTAEYGTYGYEKLNGFINIPIGDKVALRIAGIAMKRDGFQDNAYNNQAIDDRSLGATRMTVSFKPTDTFRGYVMWEHFNEGDTRNGGAKTICANDPGPTSVGGVSLTDGNPNNSSIRNYLSQGCSPTSIYNAPAVQTGATNTVATFAGRLASLLPIGSPATTGDVDANTRQPLDPRGVLLTANPTYRAKNDVAQANFEWDATDALKVSSLTTFTQDHLINSSGGIPATTPFNNTVVTPGGVFSDPQLGDSQFLQAGSYQNLKAQEWSSELRLQSNFAGPVNFSLGAIYLHLHRFNDVFVPANGLTLASVYLNAASPLGNGVDSSRIPQGGGHNYFESINPYRLTSKAAFGEVYWQATDTIRFTAGLRYTDDDKKAPYIQQEILAPGYGLPADQPVLAADFKELTGRLNVDWQPKLSFTDSTLVYASYARGYKGGGFNPPDVTGPLPPYDPEFVNAYEIGTKNTLLNRSLQLNLTGFYYDYKNYQYSRAAALTALTTNVDAKIYGAEFESIWNPIRNLRLNANVGYLHSEIEDGPNASAVDPYNLTQSNPNLSVLKNLTGTCTVNTAGLAALLGAVKAGAVPSSALAGSSSFDLCSASGAATAALFNLNPTANGVTTSIAGNQLPTSPHWTAAIGAQYKVDVTDNWTVIPRVDFHYTSSQYSDVFNDADDRVKGWASASATVTLTKLDTGLQIQAFAKNIAKKNTIVGAVGPSATVGDTRTIILLDPTTYGVSVTANF